MLRVRRHHAQGGRSSPRTWRSIKVAARRRARTQVMQLVDVFRARVVDVAPNSRSSSRSPARRIRSTVSTGAAPLRRRRDGRAPGRRRWRAATSRAVVAADPPACVRRRRSARKTRRRFRRRTPQRQLAMSRLIPRVSSDFQLLRALRAFSIYVMAKIYYDKDADLSLIQARRSPSSATARRATRTR